MPILLCIIVYSKKSFSGRQLKAKAFVTPVFPHDTRLGLKCVANPPPKLGLCFCVGGFLLFKTFPRRGLLQCWERT